MKETLQTIKVLYVESENGIAGSHEAFDRLEKPLPTLRGRKFYGTYDSENGIYRACVKLEIETDKPKEWGLKITNIPGGKYVKDKIKNWVGKENLIGEVFTKLSKSHRTDKGRPSIEFYRSQRELILYLPVMD